MTPILSFKFIKETGRGWGILEKIIQRVMLEVENNLKLGCSRIGWAYPILAERKLSLGHLCPSHSFLCSFITSSSKAISVCLQSLGILVWVLKDEITVFDLFFPHLIYSIFQCLTGCVRYNLLPNSALSFRRHGFGKF